MLAGFMPRHESADIPGQSFRRARLLGQRRHSDTGATGDARAGGTRAEQKGKKRFHGNLFDLRFEKLGLPLVEAG
jgi:hypothetical protein